jgi:hypothetical protein
MRRLGAFFALLAGCTAPSPSPRPYAPDSEDRAALRQRLQAASEAPFVMGRFYGEYEVGGKVLFSCRGTSRGYRSGVVLIEEESKTGPPLRALRVGDKAWIYKEGWQDTAGTDCEGLGTGFQNPHHVLTALDSAESVFIPYQQGGIDCPVRDRSFLRALSDRAGAHPPADAPILGVLKAGFREGPLVTRFSFELEPQISGQPVIVWIAKMDIVSWGAAPPMTFDDIPAPFTPDMKAAVRKATEGK